jgi:UDP-N-acetylmuramoyl-tripeptide--D-alanyl-D-alanine ligase
MLKAVIYLYRPAYARAIVYMLQAAEYKPGAFIRWYWRTKDFSRVAYRKALVPTRPARLLLAAFTAGTLTEVIISIVLFTAGVSNNNHALMVYAVSLFLITPVLWAHLIIIPLFLGEWFIVKPRNSLKVRRASRIFAGHTGARIAIAGSYGKTTMKEIMLSVLSEGKKVAATPANRNVAISHALFADKLKGDEDILIIEYGEGAPGDVAKFAKNTHPTAGIITGLAPAHIDRYKTLENAGRDIFSLAKFIKKHELFVNGDADAAKQFIHNGNIVFDSEGIDGWKVSGVKLSKSGLSFNLAGKGEDLKIRSKLLGRHQIAPLALAAFLGKKYGLSDEQIKAGIAKIEPFEHRMKPYELSGAWIIDDTYNGNIEGMKAGLALLAELPAKRKIYITPGLVDQGAEEKPVHRELGKAITKANPDKVVLMKHSVTEFILEGLDGYKGQLVIEEDPLDFYTNLDKFVAAGDLVLMQNDWPDNYN